MEQYSGRTAHHRQRVLGGLDVRALGADRNPVWQQHYAGVVGLDSLLRVAAVKS